MKQQKGFTLIEVLVSFVILTVGLLGVAGLQMTGMKSVQGSVYRYEASRLAEDLADRIRANIPGLRGKYYVVKADVINPITINSLAGTTVTDCASTACDDEQLATYDLKTWASELKSVLQVSDTDEKAIVSVECSDSDACAADAVVTIIITWQERADLGERDANAPTTVDADAQMTAGSFTLNSVF